MQPIFFSHVIHTGSYQIACQYCHAGARRSSDAGRALGGEVHGLPQDRGRPGQRAGPEAPRLLGTSSSPSRGCGSSGSPSTRSSRTRPHPGGARRARPATAASRRWSRCTPTTGQSIVNDLMNLAGMPVPAAQADHGLVRRVPPRRERQGRAGGAAAAGRLARRCPARGQRDARAQRAARVRRLPPLAESPSPLRGEGRGSGAEGRGAAMQVIATTLVRLSRRRRGGLRHAIRGGDRARDPTRRHVRPRARWARRPPRQCARLVPGPHRHRVARGGPPDGASACACSRAGCPPRPSPR